MAYDPTFGGGGGGGGGGGYDPTFGGGGGRGGSSGGGGGRPKVRESHPVKDLGAAAVRLVRTIPNLKGDQRQRAIDVFTSKIKGLPKEQLRRIDASIPVAGNDPSLGIQLHQAVRDANPKHYNPGSGIGFVKGGGMALTGALNVLNAPAQAVTSTVAEATREGGWQHSDPGKLLEAAKEGLLNQRHDTISSIFAESGHPIKNKALAFTADVAGGIALDPLTYVSFGTSRLAQSGTRASVGVLGAERTAEVIDKGAKILSAEEKARLAANMSPRVYEAFIKGARGGVKVAHPTLNPRTILRRHSLLSEPRTVIAGPFTRAKAGRLIESTGGLSTAEQKGILAAQDLARESSRRADELRARADLADLAAEQAPVRVGAPGEGSGRGAALRAQADQLDAEAADAARQAEEAIVAGRDAAKSASARLVNHPLNRLGNRLGDTALADSLRGVFVPRGNVAHAFGEAAAHDLDTLRTQFQGSFTTAVADHVAKLRHAARESKATTDDLTHIIGPAMDVGGKGRAAIPDRLKPMYDALNDLRHDITQRQIAAGVARETALHNTDEYFARYLTQEATEAIYGKGASKLPLVPGEPNVTRMRSSNLRARRANKELSIQEINDQSLAQHGFKTFEENPLIAGSRRAVEAERDIAQRTYTNGVLQLRDRAGNRIVFTADELKGKRPAGYQELKTPQGVIYAPPEVAQEVKKTMGLFTDDKALHNFLRGVDRWMTLWKGYATVPLPFGLGFHMRNAVGNVFNAWLRGLQPGSSEYAWAFKVQRQMRKGRREGDVLKYLKGSDRDVIEHALKDSTLDTRFVDIDLPKSSTEAVEVPFRNASAGQKARRAGRAANPLNPHNALISSGRAMASGIESNARLALYRYVYKQTGSFDDAARDVRKYLFDYGDLTPTEQQVFKRLKAFYCVPDDHEILTRRGWMRHDDLIVGEDVMVLDPQTHELRWEPLLDVARFDYDGELRTLERRGGRFLFTDDHRWPVEVNRTKVKGKWYGGERKIVRAHELNTTHRIPLTGEFNDYGQSSLLSPRHAAILGWVVTDGHGRWNGPNNWQAVVYQSPGKHLDEIIELLGTSPRKPHPDTGVVPVPVGLEDRNAITKHYHEKNDLPSLVTHLDREAAEAMWQAMFKAEGWTSGNGTQGFAQQRSPVAAAFQILCYMTGRSLWLGKGTSHYVRTSTSLGVKEGMGREHYRGTIWCPQTPTGTWLMRHDGAVIPTGNTYSRKNIPLQLGAMVTTPGKFSHLRTVQLALADQASAPEGLYPSYLPELGGVPLPASVKVNGNRVVYAPDLPVNNAANELDPVLNLIAAGVPGADKVLPKNEQGLPGALRDILPSLVSGGAPGAALTGAQIAGGESFFSGRRLQGNVQAPFYATPFARERYVEGKMRPSITTAQQFAAEDLLPILGKFSSAFPRGQFEKSKQSRRLLSTLTGQRIYELSKGTNRAEALRRLEIISQLLADIRARGIEPASSR